ncbi:hypothetical protein [Azospirillum argentinense]|uniref:hypothetical protein n=1 Tax=Azospirillum argentinense TaxID=2970906 RepID=UPI0032DEF417
MSDQKTRYIVAIGGADGLSFDKAVYATAAAAEAHVRNVLAPANRRLHTEHVTAGETWFCLDGHDPADWSAAVIRLLI